MSFKCDFCGVVQKNRVSPVMFVTKWRPVEYPVRRNAVGVIDPGGKGWEIEKENKACPECAKQSQEKV